MKFRLLNSLPPKWWTIYYHTVLVVPLSICNADLLSRSATATRQSTLLCLYDHPGMYNWFNMVIHHSVAIEIIYHSISICLVSIKTFDFCFFLPIKPIYRIHTVSISTLVNDDYDDISAHFDQLSSIKKRTIRYEACCSFGTHCVAVVVFSCIDQEELDSFFCLIYQFGPAAWHCILLPNCILNNDIIIIIWSTHWHIVKPPQTTIPFFHSSILIE